MDVEERRSMEQSINHLLPKPHWSKDIFKRHSIPISAIARHLDVNYTYASSILNGHIRITELNEEKLKELVSRLDKNGNKGHE